MLSEVRVLIAEANPVLASGLRLMLEQWDVGGCETVSTHAELAAALSEATPDVVLFNIDLVSGVDEIEALLRRHPVGAIGVAAHFLTSDWAMQDKAPILEMPFGLDKLLSAILSAAGKTGKGIAPTGGGEVRRPATASQR
ncbi:response regulator transcription factor [Azospirillum brasilense]|uniref:Response regulatory domain-containing protein n=1 Tax=Azospirillum brasilense TaxID=192 RepID=A0A235HGG5_AZOBR|nr:response regulator transcription factor [Azospirillum brasilense]OYD84782.1 hypothetical protein CHT98_07700 [Azospirillum brasilense]